jgi:AcrR family transcriptional regulator
MKKEKYHHRDLRSDLVRAASRILEEEGLESLTMRHLSKTIGVSRSASYRHFQDKTALLGAVAADGFHELRESIVGIFDDDSSPLELFRSCSYAYVRFAVTRPTLYNLMFGFELNDGAPVPELSDAAASALLVITEVISRCQHEGSFRSSEPVELANVTWSSLHGLSMLLIDGAVRMSRDGGLLHAQMTDSDVIHVEDIPSISSSVIETLLRGFGKDCS